MISYPGAPVVQFDISSLNITDNDVAVLVLKAASMQDQGSRHGRIDVHRLRLG